MRVSVGYGERSMSTRRALASCGTRQTSASVGVSPWQKRPVAGSRASCGSSASRPTSIQYLYQRPSAPRSHAHRVQSGSAARAGCRSGWMSQAIAMRDRAHARAAAASAGQQRRRRMRLVEVLDDRERLREHRAVVGHERRHEALRIDARGSPRRAARPCAGGRTRARRATPFRLSAMRTRYAADERK